MNALQIPASDWRRRIASALDASSQTGQPIILTNHGKMRFGLILLRSYMNAPAMNSLMGEMRALWTSLTDIEIEPDAPFTHYSSDDFRQDMGHLVRTMGLAPHFFTRRYQVVAVIIPNPLSRPDLDFSVILREFWKMVTAWDARQQGR